MLRLSGLLMVILVVVMGSSCGNIKNLQYVQGTFDTAALSKIQFTEPIIQKGDLLSITLYSDDAASTAAVIAQASSANPKTENANLGTNAVAAGLSSGYLVGDDGFIRFFKIGSIKAEGLTKKQLADSLANRYLSLDLLKNPFVEIRFLNYKVTVVGEVTKPGTYSIPAERVNIFEAISLAGDITTYGRRNNVLVVRESNGERKFAQLDLSKPDVFSSPYYFLQQNDVIIVDVGKNKAALNDQSTARNITIAASVLATIAIFINIFK